MRELLILAGVLLVLAGVLFQGKLRRQTRKAREMEERLRKENEERRETASLLKLQRDLAVELGAKSSLQESLDCILDMLGTVPGVDGGGIYLVQPDGSLELAAHRNLSDSFVAGNRHVAGDSPRGKMVHEGRVCSQDYNSLLPDALLERIRSVLVVPVVFHGKLVAVLNMASRSVPAFQPQMQTAIEAAAEHIGGIVARIRAQDVSKEREHSFRNLAESAFDAIAIVGADRKFIYVNPQFTDLTGYAESELLGKAFDMTLHPDQRALALTRFEDRLKGLPVPSRYDALYDRKDGTTVPVRFSARRIAWMGQPAVIGYVQDQSDRKQKERALQEAKEAMDAFFDFLPLAILVMDEKTRIVRVNVAGLELVQAGEVSDLLQKRPGEALNCVHSHDSPDGCGSGPSCPVCDLRRSLESVLKVEGSIRGAEVTVQLKRQDGPCKVQLRINAEPILLHNQKHVIVAIEDVTNRTPSRA
jgi:PAS domain S-box-containing protein